MFKWAKSKKYEASVSINYIHFKYQMKNSIESWICELEDEVKDWLKDNVSSYEYIRGSPPFERFFHNVDSSYLKIFKLANPRIIFKKKEDAILFKLIYG